MKIQNSVVNPNLRNAERKFASMFFSHMMNEMTKEIEISRGAGSDAYKMLINNAFADQMSNSGFSSEIMRFLAIKDR